MRIHVFWTATMNCCVFNNDLFQRRVQNGSKKPSPQQQLQNKQTKKPSNKHTIKKNPTNELENLLKKLHVLLIFIWLRSGSSFEILGERQANSTKAVKYNYIQKH